MNLLMIKKLKMQRMKMSNQSKLSNFSHLNPVLMHKLEVLKPYLEMQANELCFNNEKEIYIDKGDTWEHVIDERLDKRFLEDLLVQLATRRGQRFNEKYPHLSCELPKPYNRYRVQAQHKSTLFNSEIGICIRIPSKQVFEIENFELSQEVLDKGYTYEVIKNMVRQRKNILVSGGTSSGKTSFLNCLIKEIDKDDRVVTIEDAQELFIPNPNAMRLSVPKEENEIYGYSQAINNAMRLNPTRLFLGEIDIRNTFPFLRINNTGHAGSLSTLHANSAKESIEAIITNIIIGGSLKDPDRKTLLKLITVAIDYIIQINKRGSARIITDILDLKKAKQMLFDKKSKKSTQAKEENHG